MTLSIGRVTLDEGPMRPFSEAWSDSGRQVTLSGVLHSLNTSNYQLKKLQDDIMGLAYSTCPVLFGVKSHRNAYYSVDSSKSSIVELGDQDLIQLSWEIALTRQGADNQVDLESRLSGPVNRLNDFALSGNRWHCPPQAHKMYWAESTTPSQVSRVGSEGTLRTYVGLTQTVNPRWHCDVDKYFGARVRVLDQGGILERSGVGGTLDADWAIHNTLVKMSIVSGGGFNFSIWDSGAWSTPKKVNLTVAGTPLTNPVTVVILHNEYEQVTVRVMWDRTTSGRVWSDFILRRGSRFIELVMKANASTTLGIVGGVNEASTAGTGFIRATSNDVGGNRYVFASSKTFTSDLVAGGISKASIVRFDAMIGYEFNGSSAASGDQASDIVAQYLGSPAEVVMAVKR
jgi:hypothetical protein